MFNDTKNRSAIGCQKKAIPRRPFLPQISEESELESLSEVMNFRRKEGGSDVFNHFQMTSGQERQFTKTISAFARNKQFMQLPFSLVISHCAASSITKTSLVYAMINRLLPTNSFLTFVNMSAPQKRKLTQCESDQNLQQFYNDLHNSDTSEADSVFSTNDE